jgi:sugar/nucleoside kinase (ribokinase family)
MKTKKYDVCGIGNALLDFIVELDDKSLEEIGLKKGEMQFISKEKSKEILSKIDNSKLKIVPGGSSANAMAGVAFLGGKSVFLGKVGKDEHGELYEQKTKEDGVDTMLAKHDGEGTGHAITFVTPDSERTFAVYMGAAMHLSKEDISEEAIKESKILHIEGYQLDDVRLREAALHAMEIANKNDVKVSIDLADSGVVSRNLEFLKQIVKKNADIVFANEAEAKAFTGKNPGYSLHDIYEMCGDVAVVKLGEKGSMVKINYKVYDFNAYRVNAVDTTGAGDMYAAALLYGITHGLPIEKIGKLASYTSALVVANKGARLDKSFKEKIKIIR